jgi:serum/glucocorticoid-regulated kinase 2
VCTWHTIKGQHDSSSSELYALKVIDERRVLASREVQRTLTEQAVLRRMATEGINPFVIKLRRSFYDENHLYLAMVRLIYAFS